MGIPFFRGRRRAPKLPTPISIDDPIVSKSMTIAALIVPGDEVFAPTYTDDDLQGLKNRDRVTVRQMSILEQWSVWHTEQVALLNSQARQLEAEKIQQSIEIERLRKVLQEHDWKLSFGMWVVMTIGAGTVAAGLKFAFDFFK